MCTGTRQETLEGGDHQIDVLIIDDSHHRFGKIEEPNTYFIEGILAGGEVKASLQMGQNGSDIQTGCRLQET